MKRLLLFMLLVNELSANGQGFAGAQGFVATGSSNSSAGTGAMAFDKNNNRYILGTFNGTLDMDAGPGIYSFTSIGLINNMFLLKEDAAGNFVWAKHFAGLSPGSYGLGGSAIDFDASGNIYIGGDIRDSFDMDPGPGVYRFSTNDALVAFILKLDSSGNFVWAKKHEVDSVNMNTSAIAGMKVIGDAIYAAGSFNGTVDLDPGPNSFKVTCTPGVGPDMVLIKMDTAGNFIWGKTIGGTGLDNLASFTADSAANLYITGGFQNTVDFNPGPGVDTLTAKFNSNLFEASDIFVAKYDSAGNYRWAKAVGGSNRDFAWKLAVDARGNVFTTGFFSSIVDFDPGPGVYNLGTAGSAKQIFTLKLYGNGNFAWARKMVGGGEGRAIATDDSGNVYTAAINGGCFAQKLDSAGNFVWDARWQADGPAWIGLDKKDSVYITGAFSGIGKDFDPGPGVFLLSGNSSNPSGFILKLNQIPLPTGIEAASVQTAVSVYPNPSSGIITFSSQFGIRRIELTDMTGKVVYVAEPARAKTVIDLGGRAAGVYFYEVDCGAGKQRGKLMVY